MHKFIKLLFLFLLSIFYINAYAIQAPSNLKLEYSDINELKVSWSSISGTPGYYVFYSKTPLKDTDNLDSVGSELISTNNYLISNIDSATDYYVYVKSVDETGKSSVLSKELKVSTSKLDNLSNFALYKVNIISSKKLLLIFNYPIENGTGAIRDFKIVNKNNDLDILDISKYTLKLNNQLEVDLSRDLKTLTNYEISALFINDKDGNSITKGVNGIINFKTPKDFNSATQQSFVNDVVLEKTKNDLESNKDIPLPEVNILVLDKNNNKNIKKDINIGGSPAEGDAKNLKNDTKISVENVNNLPNTGPESLFIIFISFLVGIMIFVFKLRSKNI